MKKLITLGFCLFFLSSSFAQKLDYDKDSKWFLGLNIGGAWNTTDVKNKTNLGYGVILGRSFNYGYGKKVSYDLRLRYLGGNWYGQDFDTTNVKGNSLYDADGPVAQLYDSLGYTINNFNTEAHEAGLELAIHLNSLREKTGWDPYIFGGVGIVWNKTLGDLYSQDSSNASNNAFYQYGVDGVSKTELDILSDNIYDTQLNGKKGYKVNFVPSLGIGLAYQVGPKFSIGLEHRTMFYLENDFDGFNGDSRKWGLKNDLYHYSGLALKFNLGRFGDSRVENDNTNTNAGNPIDAGSGGCEDPKINIRKPSVRSIKVTEAEYNFDAIIKEIASRDNILFTVNGSVSTNFTYNVSNGRFQSTLLLKSGPNEIIVRASNGCGTTEEKITITYDDCIAPKIVFTSPGGNNITVDQPLFTVGANISNSNQVTYQVNGINSTNFSLLSDGQFSSALRLKDGVNTVRIIAKNECGTDEETVTINYTACAVPYVFLSEASGKTVSDPVLSLEAEIGNITNKQSIQFTVNGSSKSFTYNPVSKKFQSSIALKPGTNTLQVTVTNDCGTDTKTITIIYEPCKEPIVDILLPASASTTVNVTSQLIKAQIQNVASAAEIQLRVNGTVQSGGSYNTVTGIFQKTILLNEGINTVEITVSTDCGTVTKVIKVTKRPCVGPQLSMIVPATQNSTVQGNSLVLKTLVSNVSSSSQIKLFLNGSAIFGGAYNSSTKIFQRALTLKAGVNTIKVIATNDCSSAELIYSVNYAPCVAPDVTIITPTASTLETPTTELKAIVTNVNAASDILLTVNGITVTGGTYNTVTNQFVRTITLNPGANTIVVQGQNECGSDLASIVVNYRPCTGPVITKIQPSSETTVSQVNTYLFKALVSNVSAASQVKLFVNGSPILGGGYNASTQIFQKTIYLNNGANTIKLIATNNCSSSEQVYTVNYTPCVSPNVTLVTPTNAGMNTSNSSMQVQAVITNISSSSEVQLMVNGVGISGGSYNAQTQLYTHDVSLNQGVNTIVVKGTNSCGVDEVSSTVTYTPCKGATITMVDPLSASTSTESSSYTVKATIANVTSVNQIQLSLNGSTVSAGTFNTATKLFQKGISLVEGVNTITITATNSCGSETHTFLINYQPCITPTLTFVEPTTPTVNAVSGTVLVKAVVQNVSSANQIVLTVNNTVIGGGAYNSSTGIFEQTVNVTAAVSTVKVKVTTDCGVVEKSFVVKHNPCVPPTMTLVSPATPTVDSPSGSVNITANLQNITSANQVNVTVNGASVNGGSFNASTGVFTQTVNVSQSVSTIVVTATNDCGTVHKSFVVKHNPCVSPTMTLVSPATPTMDSPSGSVNITANLQNIASANQINVTVNGAAVNGGSFNASTGVYTQTINVTQATSTVVVTAANECGTTSKSFVVKHSPCVAPTLTLVGPKGNESAEKTIPVQVQFANIATRNELTLQVNGITIAGGAFNASAGTYQNNVILKEGSNVIVITVANACGNDSETITINYQPCLEPSIRMIKPAKTDIVTRKSMEQLQAQILNIDNASQITLTVNGKTTVGWKYNTATNMFTHNLRLNKGKNKITITVKTDCGEVSTVIYITFDPCAAPVLTLLQPSKPSVNIDGNMYMFKASVQNITSLNQISVTVNGAPVSGGVLNAGVYEHQIEVRDVKSTVKIRVTNDCGAQEQSFVINQIPCKKPTLTLKSPTKLETQDAMVDIQAIILNVESANQITLKVNGLIVSGALYNASTGLYKKTVNLKVGANTIQLKATTDCGTVEKTFVVKRNQEQLITICHKHPGVPSEQMQIPLSKWPEHQAHGDVLGPCPPENTNDVEEAEPSGSGIGIGGSGNSTNGGSVTGGNNHDNGGDGGKRSESKKTDKPIVKPAPKKEKPASEKEKKPESPASEPSKEKRGK